MDDALNGVFFGALFAFGVGVGLFALGDTSSWRLALLGGISAAFGYWRGAAALRRHLSPSPPQVR